MSFKHNDAGSTNCPLVQLFRLLIGPIPWGHSGPLCHALSSSLWTSMRRRRATVQWRHLVNWRETARCREWAQHFSNASCYSIREDRILAAVPCTSNSSKFPRMSSSSRNVFIQSKELVQIKPFSTARAGDAAYSQITPSRDFAHPCR